MALRRRLGGGPTATVLGLVLMAVGASLTLRAAPASAAPPNDPLLTGFVIEGGGGLENVVEGPDGNMWFTAPGAGAIGRLDVLDRRTLFPLPDASAAPIGLTVGPDGALWFTELSANKIGRITTWERSASTRSRRPTVHRSVSRRDPTAHCGSPRAARTRSVG